MSNNPSPGSSPRALPLVYRPQIMHRKNSSDMTSGSRENRRPPKSFGGFLGLFLFGKGCGGSIKKQWTQAFMSWLSGDSPRHPPPPDESGPLREMLSLVTGELVSTPPLREAGTRQRRYASEKREPISTIMCLTCKVARVTDYRRSGGVAMSPRLCRSPFASTSVLLMGSSPQKASS